MNAGAYEFEAVPRVAVDGGAPHAGIVVMKFGGASVGDAGRIRRVARRLVSAREGGAKVVGVVSAMGKTTDDLLSLAGEVSERPDARELDMLLTVGERISCALVAMAINDLGPEAISLTGSQAGIVTDTAHGEAKIVEVRARRIHEALEHDRVVLVAGFQGISTDLALTTLGRGGSDATAVALAAALGADACEIYTDADGVFTADPRVVPDARRLVAVSYDEMLELAASGATVLQLRSVEFARNHGVRLHVRSNLTDEPGTWVTGEDDPLLEKAMISGVTSTTQDAVYRVQGTSAAVLFPSLAAENVNVDTIIQASADVTAFSAPLTDAQTTGAILDRLGSCWSQRDDLGKVSVVGAGVKSQPGIAAAAFTALHGVGIELHLVSTSPVRIAFYVHEDEVDDAVRTLHATFGLGSSLPSSG